MRELITLHVNGERHELAVLPHRTLLEVLREDMGLIGTKHGCELGECGACTVLIDGAPVLSCLTFAHRSAGQRNHHHRRPGEQWQIASPPGNLRRTRRGPVRLLHPRHAPLGRRSSRSSPPAHPRPGKRSPRRKPLPLHRLHQNLRGRRGRLPTHHR